MHVGYGMQYSILAAALQYSTDELVRSDGCTMDEGRQLPAMELRDPISRAWVSSETDEDVMICLDILV